MVDVSEKIDDIATRVLSTPYKHRRRLVALAGAPASGKSTAAELLAARLREKGASVHVVPMDGFHLDNVILTDRDLLARKGAPMTFDASGFVNLVSRLQREDTVTYPLFDRSRDIAIAGAAEVDAQCDTVIVEGNYVLLDVEPWNSLAAMWDVSIVLDVPIEVLEKRLVARWISHGFDEQAAIKRAHQNDLLNARTVVDHMLRADIKVALA